MSRVAEMRTLTEDLARSHEQRIAGLASRRADSQHARDETRRQMAARHVARTDAAAAMQQELAEDAAKRKASTASYLASASRARAEISARQRTTLARATSDRQAKVQEMRADTRSAIRNTHDARVTDEANLRARLAGDRSDLAQQVGDFVSGISRARAAAAAEQGEALAQGHAKLVFDTASFLGAVRDAHEALAKCQGEALANGRAALHAEVAATLGGIHSAREALAANLVDFGQVWQNFAETMQARRTGAPAAGAKAEKTRAKASPPVEPHAAPAPERAEAPEQVNTTPSDEAVFRYLADHPDGLRLIELEEYFGIARIRMANIVNRLIEENKARKDEERKIYFAT